MDTDQAADAVMNFQIDGRPVRGRMAMLGEATLDPILKRHDYPTEIARLLGEALVLATLVGSSLKFQGKLLVQAEGDGIISMLVGEYTTDGNLRAYARFDKARWARLERINKGQRPHIPQLFGRGALGLIIVHDDPSMQPYQGLVPLEKATLSECAEVYFNTSEQVPSQLRLAVGELSVPGEATRWIGGGALIQQVAGDDKRGDTDDAWETASALFATLSDEELIDPAVSINQLLFRLFHEDGVRVETAQALADACSCNEERLVRTLASLPDSELRDLAEPDGTLEVDCQFCARKYAVPIGDVTEKAD
jgi:molecular chaperone Hsp33